MATDPTVERARKMGERMPTERHGHEAIALTLATLRKAVNIVADFSTTDKGAGLVTAYASRIQQQMDRLAEVQKRTPYTRDVANAIALAVLQSDTLLRDLQRDTRESQQGATVAAMVEQFAEALRQILEKATTSLLGGWGWLVVAYLLFRDKE